MWMVPCETLQASTVAEEMVAQGTTGEMGCMGRHMSTLMVTMQREVEAQQILKVLILLPTLARSLPAGK